MYPRGTSAPSYPFSLVELHKNYRKNTFFPRNAALDGFITSSAPVIRFLKVSFFNARPKTYQLNTLLAKGYLPLLHLKWPK